MARTDSTLRSLFSTRAAKVLSLLAAVLLLSALAPAAAFAEGPWADEKLQQLYEANEAAQAELEAAQDACDEADAIVTQCENALQAAKENNSFVQEFWHNILMAMNDLDAAETEVEIEEATDALNLAIQEAAIALGLPEDKEVIEQYCVGAAAALRDAAQAVADARTARKAAYDEYEKVNEKACAAKEAYESYAELETIELTFDLGGGALGSETGTITRMTKVGDVVQLPDAPTLEGYTFKFWKGSEYAAGAEYTVEGEHAFAAEWEQNASSDEKSDSNKSGSNAKSKIPATGDDMSKVVIPLSVAAGVALIVLIGAAIKRRRGKN